MALNCACFEKCFLVLIVENANALMSYCMTQEYTGNATIHEGEAGGTFCLAFDQG